MPSVGKDQKVVSKFPSNYFTSRNLYDMSSLIKGMSVQRLLLSFSIWKQTNDRKRLELVMNRVSSLKQLEVIVSSCERSTPKMKTCVHVGMYCQMDISSLGIRSTCHKHYRGAKLQKMFLIISLRLEVENSYQKHERNIFLNYLRNGIQSIFNLMRIWMIIQIMMVQKILLGTKACKISIMMTTLVSIKRL